MLFLFDGLNKTDNVRTNVNIEVRPRNNCCHLKAMRITYPESLSAAWGIQYAMRMHDIVICALPALLYFSTLSHKLHCFRKKRVLNIKRLFWFPAQFLFETFLIVRRSERNVIINVHMCSCVVPVILVRFLCNLNFLDMFSQNIKILNFLTIRLVGVELFHADERHTDGQTDRQIDRQTHNGPNSRS